MQHSSKSGKAFTPANDPPPTRRRTWSAFSPDLLIAPRRSAFSSSAAGAGANLWFILREGFQVAGIDISATALASARARLDAEPTLAAASADLWQGDFQALPWPDDSFDVTVDIEAIYAKDRTRIMAVPAEIRRVLRPGGVHFGQMFGVQTTGFTAGPGADPHTTDPTDGPCAGLGPAHFFDAPELHHLFAEFELSLDWIKRTDLGGAWVVFEWIVRARKPA